ncbi:hypothetical protein [Microbacterium invictum]|uniref:Uncharacterized protein n=1 Tax=Microbacterium invictum TaxID=515415 RepID=A0ABZ0VFG0_9MICO|nr:hypothetical protein [Microbacterium invictum]WQB71582.1 hypothetical protein T9R20_06390 [Microbacterium invictum]
MSVAIVSVMRRMPGGLVIAAIIAGLLVLGGITVYLVGNSAGAASFGWFAYQPLAGAAFFPSSLVVLTPLMVAGVAIAVAGLLGFGIIAGFLLGRRHPTGR